MEKITKNKSEGVNYITDGSFLGETASKMIILGPGPLILTNLMNGLARKVYTKLNSFIRK